MKNRVLQAVKCIAYTMITSVFIFHFLMTAVYVSPPNPIKTVTNLPNMYIGTFFPQEWAFFSPEPIDSDLGLSIQCVDSENGENSELLDVMTGLWEGHKRNRFSPYDRIQRVPGNYVFSKFSVDPGDAPMLEACMKNPDISGCEDLDAAYVLQNNLATDALSKVASTFCEDIEVGKYESANLVIWETAVPRWSKRYQSEKEKLTIEEITNVALTSASAFGIWRQ